MKTAALILLLLSAVLITEYAAAEWYEGSYTYTTPDMPEGVCVDCDDDDGSGSNNVTVEREYEGPSARDVWQREENARLEQNARVAALNTQGNDAWGRKDYREALRCYLEQQAVFDGPNVRNVISTAEAQIAWSESTTAADHRRAVAMRPDLFTQENIQYIEKLEAWEKYSERLASDKRDASRMGDRMNTFASSLDRAESAPVNMDFGDPAEGSALEFGDPDSGGAIAAFPQGGVPKSEAELAGRDIIPPGTNVEAAAQLKTVFGHSMLAGLFGNKEEASKGFDTAGRENGTLVFGGASAGPPLAVFTDLPDIAKSDAQVLQSVAYYQKLESLKAETAQKIEAVKAEQKTGKGDPVVLAAQLGTLTNDIQRQESDQAEVKKIVKKRVVDLGYDWTETAASATPTANLTPAPMATPTPTRADSK